MKLPIWFKKSKGGYFYIPVHWAGWLCYIVIFVDVMAAFYKLSEGTTNTTEQLKAVAPIVILNFFVLAVVIFLTTEKPKEEN
jgi:uncharacterized membrane protein